MPPLRRSSDVQAHWELIRDPEKTENLWINIYGVAYKSPNTEDSYIGPVNVVSWSHQPFDARLKQSRRGSVALKSIAETTENHPDADGQKAIVVGIAPRFGAWYHKPSDGPEQPVAHANQQDPAVGSYLVIDSDPGDCRAAMKMTSQRLIDLDGRDFYRLYDPNGEGICRTAAANVQDIFFPARMMTKGVIVTKVRHRRHRMTLAQSLSDLIDLATRSDLSPITSPDEENRQACHSVAQSKLEDEQGDPSGSLEPISTEPPSNISPVFDEEPTQSFHNSSSDAVDFVTYSSLPDAAMSDVRAPGYESQPGTYAVDQGPTSPNEAEHSQENTSLRTLLQVVLQTWPHLGSSLRSDGGLNAEVLDCMLHATLQKKNGHAIMLTNCSFLSKFCRALSKVRGCQGAQLESEMAKEALQTVFDDFQEDEGRPPNGDIESQTVSIAKALCEHLSSMCWAQTEIFGEKLLEEQEIMLRAYGRIG